MKLTGENELKVREAAVGTDDRWVLSANEPPAFKHCSQAWWGRAPHPTPLPHLKLADLSSGVGPQECVRHTLKDGVLSTGWRVD